MTTKLTLTIEEDVIKQAKVYAAESGSSLSEIVENYFKALSAPRPRKKKALAPAVKKLKGIVSLPEDADYKSIVAEEMTKKYLRK
jgi:hypothetical protein